MELLQLNMWQGRHAAQVAELIDQRNPDFITAQEIYKGGTTVLAPERMFALYDDIATRYPHHSFSAVNSLHIAGGKAEMGTAIFSKYPIIESSSFFTHGEYVDGIAVDHDVHNSRTLQRAAIDLGNTTFNLLTHHGHWVPTALGDEESVKKMQLIADYIQTLDQNDPLIFAGDFNVIPESPAMRPFDGILHDLIKEFGIKTTLSSFRKNIGNIACDHIMTNDLVKVYDLVTLEDGSSDHKPVILTFDAE